MSAADTFDPETERRNNGRTEDRMRDMEDRRNKKGRQVFQLTEERKGCYMNVTEGTGDVGMFYLLPRTCLLSALRVLTFFHEVRHLRELSLPSQMYKVDKIVADAEKAQACVKLNSKVSDKTTEFMASKRFGDGDKQAVSCSIDYLSCFQFSVRSLVPTNTLFPDQIAQILGTIPCPITWSCPSLLAQF